MKSLPILLIALTFCGLASGCSSLDLTTVPMLGGEPPVFESLTNLPNVRSVKDIDASLERILPGKPGQRHVELLLNGWGKHGSWYDLAVMRYICKYWPSAYGKAYDIDIPPMIRIIKQRVQEQPELLRQVFWYRQWEWNGVPFKHLCELCRHPGHSCVHLHGEEFPLLLTLASALDSPSMLAQCDPESIPASYYESQMEFLAASPYLRFDKVTGVYTLDIDAQRETQYLKPEEQAPIMPPTPLPDWNSDVIPTSAELRNRATS